ncbi:MAG: hypothetical protein SO005_05550, partial [Candidatus Choladocola sp.]|nr:hypothetical protein [Candidatus Choladocola sp.]
MSRKDKNSQNHPLYARVMAMILALSMLLGSSGFQVLAEEIGNQSILSGEERSAAADQDILLEEEPEQEVSSTAAASSGNTAGADGTSGVLSSDFEIEEIVETTDPGLAGNDGDDLQQTQTLTQLEWQKDNIRILAEAKDNQEFPEGSRLHFQTLDDLSDSEEGRQGWYDTYVDAAVTAYLRSNQIDEAYRDFYKEAFTAMVPFVPSVTNGEGQETALPSMAYTVQFTNSETVRKLVDKAEEVRIFVYDSEMNAKLLDSTEATVSVNESEGAYAASFTTGAQAFAVVKLDCKKLSDAETQSGAAETNAEDGLGTEAATESSLETESESETEVTAEGSQGTESESETEAVTEENQSAESESETEAVTEENQSAESESETEAVTEESPETELESDAVVDEETLPREWKDEATGVTVTITAAALPEGISLENVQVIVKALTMAENEAIRQELTPDGEESTFVGYDITLINKEDGEAFEPVSPIDVQIPLPDYLDLYEGELKVYHISEDGAKAVSSAETAEGMAGFAADSFSIWGAFKLGARMAAPVSADSLQALINQAPDGEPTTITLEKDYEENLLIPDGKDIAIDLNGHTVSSIREDGITTTLTHVSVSGKLTIKGEGSFTNKNNDTDTRGFQVHNGATLTLLGGTISGYRIADGNGGGILVSPRGTLNIEGGAISGNQASAYGGGIYAYNPLSLNFVGGVVKGNHAKYGGGIALNTLPENQVIGAVTVTENIASQDGGGFFFSGTSVDVSFDHTIITKNTASRYGGGIGYGLKAVVNLDHVTLNENVAGTYGGGARFFQGSTVTLNNSTVDGNTAYSSGGGISINHGTTANVPSTLTINGSSISENNLTSSEDLISGYGAGIYGYRYVTVILNDGEISKNTGAAYGGGIYLEYYSHLKMYGGKISENTTTPVTTAYGAGFYLWQGDFTMAGGELSDNVCTGA